MPIENPRRRVRRKRTGTRKRRTVRRRRRTNPGLMVVNRGGTVKRRRRSTSRRRVSRRRYRRNPGFRLGGFGLPPGKQVIGGLAGVLAAQAIPNLIAPAQNKGMIGPVLELVSAIGASFMLKSIAGGEIARAALVGGGIRAAYRVVSEQGLLRAIPGLSGTEAVGPVPGFAGYVDPAIAGFIDATPTLPSSGDLEGFQSDYEFEYLR